MNPTHFFLTRFGIPTPTAKTYLEAAVIVSEKDPVLIVRDDCPQDYFDIDIITRTELAHDCMKKSCADCWQSKYKGEKPQCLTTTHC